MPAWTQLAFWGCLYHHHICLSQECEVQPIHQSWREQDALGLFYSQMWVHTSFTWNGHIMSIHKYRMMSFLLSFFFFKKGLSTIVQYLTISPYKSSDVPLYGLVLRNMKSFGCLSWLLAEMISLMKVTGNLCAHPSHIIFLLPGRI